MENKMNRTNPDLDILYSRLNEIRMTPYERLTAEAQLARAEAIAELLVRTAHTVKKLARTLVVRPVQRAFEWIGA